MDAINVDVSIEISSDLLRVIEAALGTADARTCETLLRLGLREAARRGKA